MNKKNSALRVMALLVVLSLLAACGGGTSDTSERDREDTRGSGAESSPAADSTPDKPASVHTPEEPVITPPTPPSTPKPPSAAIIIEEDVSQIQDDIRTGIDNGMFMTYMNLTWTFSDGSAASHDAVMGNHSDNQFPFWFTVTLTDTSEVVFMSGLLPVGMQINEIRLDSDLPTGTYPAVVNINMVDDDGQPVENYMGIEITLVIAN